MDSLIIEQSLDVIKRLDVAFEEGQYDRQTGKDLLIAQQEIRRLLGWLKSMDTHIEELRETNARHANMINLLRSELKSIGYDDVLTVTRFD